jgi:hypothetical protein
VERPTGLAQREAAEWPLLADSGRWNGRVVQIELRRKVVAGAPYALPLTCA